MEEARTKELIEALAVGARELSDLAATAARNNKSLVGQGVYAERFHKTVVKLLKVERLVLPVVAALPGVNLASLQEQLSTVRDARATPRARDVARRQVHLICHTEILPSLGQLANAAAPTSEPVLSASVLSKAPDYLQRTLLQANGCFEKRWFEASSVMIRKLVENLIIEVYEKHQKQQDIMNKDGDYLMLNGLVNAMLSQPHWKLERETKRSLPELKVLGDRAAHKRRYQATRQDVERVFVGLRATVDDLLHLAGYK